jgi:hypothetical protein
LQQVLAPGLLRAAQERALELEIGADQVLIRWGVIEASYLQRLAAHLALETESSKRSIGPRPRYATIRCASPRNPVWCRCGGTEN